MRKIISLISSILLVLLLGACSDNTTLNDDLIYSVNQNGNDFSSLTFDYRAGTQIFQLKTNASWSLASDQDWCTISNRSGDAMNESQVINIVVAVTKNEKEAGRNAALTFSTGNQDVIINIAQGSRFDIERPEGMLLEAKDLIKQISIGWNLGNTLEATPGEETSWGNPKATKELVSSVKAMGFNAVRLPCSWNQHLDQNGNVDAAWMARVKEVVDYCVRQNVYTMLNIHWDGGWMEENCGTSYMTDTQIDQVNDKLAKIWTQIAAEFIDYDEYLLFACANEPNVKNASQMNILARYEQTFVDVVRASGGNNEFRNLIIQGPSTDMDLSVNFMKMPNDDTPNSLILEVHFYAPWSYAKPYDDPERPWEDPMATFFWGEDYIQYGKYDIMQEEAFLNLFQSMKEKFVDNDIPIIVGELGIPMREYYEPELADKFEESRAYYHRFLIENLKNNGMAPFLWDVGGYVSRYDYSIIDDTIIEAVLEGAEAGIYPF